MFGAGPNFDDSAYWIDVFQAKVGCANMKSGLCTIRANGFMYDEASKQSVLRVRQSFVQPPCQTDTGCSLKQLHFGGHFANLTALQIIASIEDSPDPVSWYIDDLEVSWSDKSCAATKKRNGFRG